jgi:hypothetical protein
MWKLPLAYGRAVVTKSWRLDMSEVAQSLKGKLLILVVRSVALEDRRCRL